MTTHNLCISHLNLYLIERRRIQLIFHFYVSFLDGSATYQPDILVSWNTAVLIVSAEELGDMKQIRLKVLTTSFKCTDCWIIVLSTDTGRLTTAPYFWNALIGLIRFYEESRPKFQLRFRLAVNKEQVASILVDIISNEQRLGNIQQYHRCFNDDQNAKLLLHFPHFNVISVGVILQQLSLVDLLTLPLEMLNETIRTELLLEKIQVQILSLTTNPRKIEMNRFVGNDNI